LRRFGNFGRVGKICSPPKGTNEIIANDVGGDEITITCGGKGIVNTCPTCGGTGEI